ncbi:prepilin-type N-terminal cleavage/methylation domain-containing protein [Parelusimicrobium proximum]|uniref:type IV pilin protein n=1 Tax=Parelusimicrobium proximum TaxID=3228953 RepID=UPI003D17EF37
MKKYFNNSAFTLIEIMVAILIVAILAAAIYPSYTKSRDKAAARDYIGRLEVIYNAQKRYYMDYKEYTANPNRLGLNYTGATVTGSGTAYKITYPGFVMDLAEDRVSIKQDRSNASFQIVRVYNRPLTRYCVALTANIERGKDVCESLGGNEKSTGLPDDLTTLGTVYEI